MKKEIFIHAIDAQANEYRARAADCDGYMSDAMAYNVNRVSCDTSIRNHRPCASSRDDSEDRGTIISFIIRSDKRLILRVYLSCTWRAHCVYLVI